MDSPRIAALKRFARGIYYAVAAAALTFTIEQLPNLGSALPGPEISIPVLMSLLLAIDKFVRARRAEQSPPPPPA